MIIDRRHGSGNGTIVWMAWHYWAVSRATLCRLVQPRRDGAALTAYPIGAYTATLESMREQDRVTAAFEQARQIFPELSQTFEGGLAHCWGLDPWQRGSFALHTPGQIGFIDTLARPEGRVHFAGEHTSVWTGWMQGALDSARRVVREING